MTPTPSAFLRALRSRFVFVSLTTRTRALLMLAVSALLLVALSLKTHRAFMMGIGSMLRTAAPSGEVRTEMTAARASSLNNFLLDPRRQGGAMFGQPVNAFFGLAPFIPSVPNITAVKSATLTGGTDVNGNGAINPSDTIVYSVVVSNSGATASNVVFTDTLNSDLTLASTPMASPIAADDSYSCIGNVGITVPAGSGLLGNDINPQGNGTLSITAVGSGTTAQNGSYSLASDGSFTYNPPVGFEGSDTFTYTLNHSNGLTGTGTVTLTVTGMIWFVNNNSSCSSNCNGRLSNPFTTLAAFNTANALSGGLNPDNNDNIFIYESASGYSGAVTLRSGQKLIGQDATASLATITGINLASFPFSNALPAMSTSAPTTNLTSTVTLNTNATVRGLQINSTSSTGMNDPGGAITGVSVSEVSVTTTTGTAVSLSSAGGTFSFKSISSNGATNGIVLNGTTGSFTITGNGGTCSSAGTCTGGAIQNATIGVSLTSANNVSIDRMFIQNTSDSGIKGTTTTNFSFTNGKIDNSGTGLGAETSNIAFNTQTAGTENNLSGTVTITGNTLTNAYYHGIDIFNFNGTISSANISNNTITSSTSTASSKGSGIRFIGFGSASTVANITQATLNQNTITNFPSTAGIMVQGGNANSPSATAGTYGTSSGSPIAITNNTISGQNASNRIGTQGILAVINGKGTGFYNIANNSVSHTFGTSIAISSLGFATVTANVTGNTIVANNALAAQGIGAGTSQTFANTDTPTLNVVIGDGTVGGANNISQTDGNGILVTARDATGTVNATIKNNTVAAPLTGNRNGIRVDAGNSLSVNDSVCLDISGNTSAGSGVTPEGIGLRKQGTSTSTNAFGIEGMSATSSPGVETFVDGQNPGSAINSGTGFRTLLISGTSGFSNCSSAAMLMTRPNQQFATHVASIAPNRNHASRELASVQNSTRVESGAPSKMPAGPMKRSLSAFSTPMSYASFSGTESSATSRGVKNNLSLKAKASNSAMVAGETVTINGGGSGFTLPTGKSTTIIFKATISGSFTGTAITNQANVAAAGPISVNSNNLSTPVIQPPTIAATFASDFVSPSTAVNLSFTVTNPNPSQSLSQVAFSNQLPAGWSVANASSSQCGGTLTTTAASRTIALSNATVAAGGTCNFTVSVTASNTEGLVTNTTSVVTTHESDDSATASDSITVISPPTLSQSFTPNNIPAGETSTLQFTLTNPNTTLALTALHYTDTLPAGVTASDVGATTVCGDGSYSISGNVITFDKPTLAASGTCQFSVTVTGATTGTKNNSTSTVTTTNSNAGTAASATLTVYLLTLGNYSNATVTAGGNTTVTPSAAPVGATYILATASTSFKGTLAVNPTTGVVTITNAGPAGSYTITVRASSTISKTFTLTVNNTSVCSTSSFATKTDNNVGSQPRSAAIGDFNGDGKQDLAIANNGANNISILLGDGSGGFGSATNFSVGTSPYTVAVGDFNGDGKLDLAVANSASNNVSILLGNGNGTFGAATNFNVGTTPYAVAVGDFNRDGKLDLAVANNGSNNASILLGDGSGSFGTATNFSVGAAPAFVAVSDFNADGKPDLVTSNSTSNNVSILLGDGSGGFGSATNFNVGNNPLSVVVGDFNADSKQDLAVANNGDNNVSILLGDGSGSFGAATNFNAGTAPSSVALGDFNGDGKSDLAVSNTSSNDVSTLLGNGSGSFGSATSFSMSTSPVSVVIGDFNGDGKLDIATANNGSDNVSVRLSNCQPNAAPTISDITNQTINEDTATSALSFTIGDVETAADSLTVTGSSSNTTLVPNTNIVFGGSGTNRTVTVTPVANLSGTAVITISVSDGSLTTSDTFTLTVTAINDPPVITVPGAQSATALSNLTIGGISVTDVDAGSGSLQVTLSASRGTLSLSQTTGLGFTSGNGNQNASMVFTGTLANINAALNNLVYRGVDASTGSDTISLAVNDQGNTGTGGAQSDSKTIGITLTKATQTINFSTLADKTYGAANFTVSATATSSLPVSLSIVSGPATLSGSTVTITGVGAVVVRASQAGDNSYSAANNVDQSFTVNKATLNVTADNQTKVYGQANPTLTFTYSGFVNSETASVLSGTPSLTTTATASSSAGGYTITAGAGTLAASNYTFNLVNGTLNITRATLTVTADDQVKVYGDANPTLTVTYSGFANNETPSALSGAPTLTTTATANSNAGSYPITITAGTLSSANYTFTLVDGTLTVDKAILTVTAEHKTKLYGAPNPPFTVTYSGFVNNDTANVLTGAIDISTDATDSSPVGVYTISTAVGTLAADNYTISLVDSTLNVTTVALTVTAENKTKTYGDANPTLTFTYSGFVNGDDASVLLGAPTLSTTAASSNVGDYPITIAQGTLQAMNYAFTFVNGTLTINKATLTATAGNNSRTYGAANPNFTGNLTGVKNNDNITSTYGTAATPSSPVGSYPITPSLVDPNNKLGNYNVTLNNGTLAVTQAALVVTADNKAKVYGSANPALTASFNGLVNGETVSALGGALTLSTTATSSSVVGNYPITVSGLTSSNYAITFVSGELTVNKAALTVTADNQSKVYGTANPNLTATISGFVNNEVLGTSGVTGSPSLNTTATDSSGVNTYQITPSLGTLASSNYSFTFVNGTLSVTPATLTVTANNASRIYGAANPTFTASYTGFVNNDTASVLSGEPSLTTAATQTSGVGSYPITASAGTLANANYTFTFVDGALTVNKAALTITADNKTKIYGTTNPDLTASYTGFANNETASALSGTLSLSTTATQTSAVGTYPITASAGTLSSANYNFTFVNGTLTVGKASTSTVLATSVSPAVYGQSITLTATVSNSTNTPNKQHLSNVGINGPSGTVHFFNGQTLLGSVSLNAGTATITTSVLTPTTYTLRAVYDGDSTFEPSTSNNLSQVVNKGVSNVAFTSAFSPTAFKQFVTLTAAVSVEVRGALAPTGTVTFREGANVLATEPINSVGQAVLRTTTLAIGTHTITADYSGDSNYQGQASAALTQTVEKGITTTTLASSANPTSFGQAVTLTATVIGRSGTPTGNVFFYDGNQLLGIAPLNGQTATLTTSNIGEGTRSLTATYQGDEQFAASTSSPLTQTMNLVCTYTLSALTQSFPLAGGSGQINVAARNGCGWQAISRASWITVRSEGRGINVNGDGTVDIIVAPLTDAVSRTGTLTIAGQTVTVTQAKPVAVVSGASFTGNEIAPGEIVSAFGADMSVGAEGATSLPLPTSLAGTQVRITDSKGVARLAPLFYVSPLQINYQVPEDSALGPATITIINGSEEVTGAGTINIALVAPGLFSVNSNGQGIAVALVQRITADGTVTFEPIWQLDPAQGKFVSSPINLGADTDLVFLVMFGTGLRNRSSLAVVTAYIGDQEVEVLYAGPQPDFVGLDQVNLRIPRSLSGKGDTEVTLTIDGKVVNTLRLTIQ